MKVIFFLSTIFISLLSCKLIEEEIHELSNIKNENIQNSNQLYRKLIRLGDDDKLKNNYYSKMKQSMEKLTNLSNENKSEDNNKYIKTKHKQISNNSKLDTTSCEILSTSLGQVIQSMLSIVGILPLIQKRQIEKPQRTWMVWGLNVSKQVAATICAFYIGIFNAYIIRKQSTKSMQSGNACSWYFITNIMESTLGIFLAISLLKLLKRLTNKQNIEQLQHLGNQQNSRSELDYTIQIKQMLYWCSIIAVVKTTVGLIIIILFILFKPFAFIIYYPFRNHNNILLGIMLIICPFFMNSLQQWIYDIYLSYKPDKLNNSEGEIEMLQTDLTKENNNERNND